MVRKWKTGIHGQYKNDSRDGDWIIYNNDGTAKYEIDYILKELQMTVRSILMSLTFSTPLRRTKVKLQTLKKQESSGNEDFESLSSNKSKYIYYSVVVHS